VELEPTPDQRELRAGCASLLAARCPASLVRQVVEKGVRAEALWADLVEQGWTSLTLPESAGGLGLGAVERGILAEELGRVVAPVPWLSTVGMYAPVVAAAASAEQAERLLEPVAQGSMLATLAVDEDGRSGSCAPARTTAHQDRGTWLLTGTKVGVPDLVGAHRVAVTTDVGVFVIDPQQAEVSAMRAVDASRGWATLMLRDTPALEHLQGDPTPGLDAAITALSAESVGVAQALLEQTISYVGVREQFGVPIGTFQAVQHGLADAHLLVQRAGAAVTYAGLCLDEHHPDRALAAAMAKAASAAAASELARVALQYHGGIGYTWEHDLQLWFKRARADAVLMGTAEAHRQRVADLVGLPR
jgi:alkylation response protein AidB-like acyl-CoA dehydrogenase